MLTWFSSTQDFECSTTLAAQCIIASTIVAHWSLVESKIQIYRAEPAWLAHIKILKSRKFWCLWLSCSCHLGAGHGCWGIGDRGAGTCVCVCMWVVVVWVRSAYTVYAYVYGWSVGGWWMVRVEGLLYNTREVEWSRPEVDLK